jgi:hypothetical protein
MSHNVTLGIVAIVAAMALTAAAFAIPQQALAYRHHHNYNSIKVDQQTSQANVCTGAAPDDGEESDENFENLETEETASAPTVCQNFGDNQADISK